MDVLFTILFFLIYSFLGWTCEVIYCYAGTKVWVNRGFLKGPICPVYGFGAMFVIWILGDLNIKETIQLFICGALIASIIEFIADIFLEYVFHTRLWNYSNRKCNIKGRVCLLNSTLFGVLAVLLIQFIHPSIKDVIGLINYTVVVVVSIFLSIIFIYDIVTTFVSVIKLNNFLNNKDGEKKEFKLIKHKRIIKAFPQLEHKKHLEEFKKLKESIIKNHLNKK